MQLNPFNRQVILKSYLDSLNPFRVSHTKSKHSFRSSNFETKNGTLRCCHLEISLISVMFFAGKAAIDLTMQGLNKKVNLERELSLHFYCTIISSVHKKSCLVFAGGSHNPYTVAFSNGMIPTLARRGGCICCSDMITVMFFSVFILTD